MENLQGSIDGVSLIDKQPEKAIELYEEMTSAHDLSFGLEITRSDSIQLSIKAELRR